MVRRIILAILVIAFLAQKTASNNTHVVGDGLGWQIQPFFPFAYVAWAVTQTFTVGDVLVFNFTSGQENVALVTKEAYLFCKSLNPISLKTIGPANFTLNSVGEHYFICTLAIHCALGQKLAIYVGSSPPNILPPPPSKNPRHSSPPPPRIIPPLLPSSSPSPIAKAPPTPPPPSPSLASAQVVGDFYIDLLCIGVAMVLVY